jgi:hypothetical protein
VVLQNRLDQVPKIVVLVSMQTNKQLHSTSEYLLVAYNHYNKPVTIESTFFAMYDS